MTMSERQHALVNDSLERCDHRTEFIDRFYELFLASSDEVKGKFNGTDFKRQKRMLRDSFYMMLMAAAGSEKAWEDLKTRADRHSKPQLDIRPELYTLWLDCLIQTVREFDPRFNEETEQAWRDVMGRMIRFMISRYDPGKATDAKP